MTMPPGLTLNSLICALAYLAVAAASLVLASGWRGRGGPGPERRLWLFVAVIFVALAGWRLGLGEIRLQESVRAFTRSDGTYEERRPGQTLMTLAAIALVMIAGWNLVFRGPRSRANLALWAAGGLVLYSAVRLVSLHAIDALIYATGPFHLNYVIDLGLTAAALGLAALELWQPAAPPRRR